MCLAAVALQFLLLKLLLLRLEIALAFHLANDGILLTLALLELLHLRQEVVSVLLLATVLLDLR